MDCPRSDEKRKGQRIGKGKKTRREIHRQTFNQLYIQYSHTVCSHKFHCYFDLIHLTVTTEHFVYDIPDEGNKLSLKATEVKFTFGKM